ncbi:MAG TPA: malto-oligosyltrehalose synthase [Gemmatimonadaceae bacterium]
MTPPALGATYRLQLHKDFTFEDARKLVAYLKRLGVTHLYASPILRARPGSTHGYDVADPTTANPELGGEEARKRLTAAIAEAGLALLLDIVPNHMGTGSANPFWEDVLTHGPASRYAGWFDIRWSNTAEPLRGHVLLPVLGDRLPAVVERGELGVALKEGRLRLTYFENDFPIDPATYPLVLDRAVAARGGKDERTAPRPGDVERLRTIARALGGLPRRVRENAEERSTRAEELLDELAALLKKSAPLRRRVERAGESFARGAAGRARLLELIRAQPYRLAFWRRAQRLINYRRFFDINELVALRMERDEVFTAVHATVLGWVADGEVQGLRVDHVDGLRDPLGYLERLRREGDARAAGKLGDEQLPILVEKILTPGERLREEWPVQGTTGYEFLNDLESVFVSAEGARAITELYHSLRPGTRREPLEDFEETAIHGKLRILGGALAPDVRSLAALLLPIAKRDRRVRALGAARLAKALTEWLACFPVYRTYIDGRTPAPTAADREVVERVVKRCSERGRIAPHAIEFLRDVMLQPLTDDDREARLRFIERLQQTSGPATAKGVEDTALYQYVPLVSLNEVGGEPVRPLERAVERFHEANAERARAWPRNLLCTNTHDTKRSADVRARIDALAERAEEWKAAVTRWRAINAPLRKRVKGGAVPDPNSEYLLYQTLLGVWPVGVEQRDAVPDGKALEGLRQRVEEYMLKAVKEAKLHTSWTDANEEYESALKEFVAAILPKKGGARSEFLRDLASFAASLDRLGRWNALARIVLHMTSPGTPDLYRGDELWNFALVDPDNRRPVDFAARAALLDELARRHDESRESRESLVRELAATPADDRAKLLVTWRALQARARNPALYRDGEYLPLTVEGARAKHAVAFARRLGGRASITIAPRLTAELGGGERVPSGVAAWEDTRVILPAELGRAELVCAITGNRVRSVSNGASTILALADVLNDFPVAVLEQS